MERKPLRLATAWQTKARSFLLASTCLSAIALAPGAARAQTALPPDATPQGGNVAAGNAAIAQGADSTIINQTSQRTVIDWQSFNVGSKATVQFVQPSATAIALNRVVTPSPSIIAGKINANGQLVLINQSGVVFTRGSEVNAESIVVSTSNIANKDFMGGHLVFSGTPNPGAKIINNGHITVKDTGLVGLVAPQVANNGVITARLGQVILAGASAFTLDLYGDRLISLDVTKAVRAVDVGGKPVAALVTNSGLIIADGGTITLTAQDADALVTQLVDAGGTIRADTVGQKTGIISISGIGGNISIAGNLLARGTAAGSTGGAIATNTTGTVNIAPTAVVDASGNAGGGIIALGTSLARASAGAADTTAPRAAAVEVASGAQIRADATARGNAGKIVLLSSGHTDFAGTISARGGMQGGNGGTIEISSDGVISLGGTVFATAIDGQNGEILLDPATLVITGVTTSTAGSTATGNTTIVGDDTSTIATSYISPTALDSLNGTIILEAASLISVASALDLTSASALTLASLGDVIISAGVTVGAAGSLEVDAIGTMTIGAPLVAGSITLQDSGNGGIDVTAGINGQNIAILNTGTGLFDIDASVSASNLISLESNGGINEQNHGAITAPTLQSSGVNTGSVTLNGAGNLIGTLAGYTLANGNFTLQDASPSLDISAPVTASTVTLADQGTLTINSSIGSNGTLENVSLIANQIAFGANGIVTAPTGSIAVTPFGNGTIDLGGTDDSALDLSPASLARLSAATLVVGSAGSFNAAGVVISGSLGLTGFADIAIDATGGIAQTGTLDVNNITLAGAGIALNGSLSAAQLLLKAGTLGVTEAETGALSTADLSGSSAGDVALTGTTNTIGTLGSFTLSANHALTLNDTGPLTITGGLFAPTATISADTLVLNGNISAVNALALISGAGGIAQNGGSITTGTLSSGGASDGGNVGLTATNNSIATLGGFTLTNGNFTLDDTASLTVAGTLTANDAILSSPSLVLNGDITTASNLTLTGTNGIAINDVIDTGTLLLESTGGITETGGIITAATLGSGGFSDGNVTLSGTSNNIGTLADFNAGDFTLADAASLTIAGTLTATNALLSSPSLSLDGAISATSNLTLIGTSGVAIGGLIDTTALLVLQSTGSITETTSQIIAGTLSSNGATDGDVTLDGTDNSIGQINNFIAGNFSLADRQGLAITGTLAAQNATLFADSITFAANIGVIGDLALDTPTGSDTQTLGTISAGTLSSIGSLGGDVLLTDAGNDIATLTSFILDGGTFAVADAAPLTLSGAIEASSATLSAASLALNSDITTTSNLTLIGTNGIAINGNIDAGTLLALEGTGDITETEATISAATLTSNGATDGNVILNGANNTIGTLAGFTASDFTFADIGALDITGPLTTANATLSAGTISIDANISATTALDLVSGNGGITQNTGSITAGTLSSGGASDGGNVILAGTGNNISTLGGFTLTSGDFMLADAGSLTTTGALIANNAVLSSSSLTLDGDIATTVDLTLTGTNGIAFGDVINTGSLLALDSAGNITQTTGSIAAGTLTSNGATDNNVTLDGSNNTIGTLAGFTAGNFIFADNGPLDITGKLTAQSATLSAATISIDADIDAITALALISGTGGVTQSIGSIITGTLSTGGASDGGNIVLTDTGNSISTLGAITLGGGTFDLADIASLTIAGVFDSGAATISAASLALNGNITAASNLSLIGGNGITIADVIDTGAQLALQSAGSITQTTGQITAGTLTSNGTNDGIVSLTGNNNQIGTLAGFTATDFTLDDAAALDVTGPIAANNVTLVDAVSLGLDAAIESGTFGTVALISNTITFSAAGAASVRAGTIEIAAFDAATDIDLGGSITGDLNLPAASLAALTAETFDIGTSSGFHTDNIVATDNVSLNGDMIIQAVDNFTQSGVIFAPDISVTAATIAITGAVSTSGTLSLTSSGAVSDSGTLNTGTIAFDSANFIQTADAGAITTDFLSGTANGGAVSLASTLNNISTLGSISATSGDFTLGDAAALNVTSTIAAANITLTDTSPTGITLAAAATLTGGNISLVSDALAAATGANITAPGTITIQPWTSGRGIDLGGIITGYLNLSPGLVAAADASILQIGNGSGNILTQNIVSIAAATLLLDGTGIVFDGSVLVPNTLILEATSGVSQNGFGTITAQTLTGGVTTVGGNVDLAEANNVIGTLAGFTLGNGNFDLNDAGILTVDGPLVAPTATLSAAGLVIDGTIVAATSLALETAGNVTEAANAAITTALLTSGGITDGSVSLTSTDNNITDLGDFTAGSFLLSEAGPLAISGPLTAQTATISASTIAISGNLGIINELALESGPGGIVQNAGSIAAGTLTSGGISDGGDVLLTSQQNNIGTLGGFTLNGGDFALVNAAPLTIAGPLDAGLASLSASSLDIAGAISVATQLTLASTGNIDETAGGIITAAFLTGGSIALGGDLDLDQANNIGALGNLSLSNGALTLFDIAPLAITGTVDATTATISAAGIDLTGTLATRDALALADNNPGGIAITGLASAGTSLFLSSDGTVTESPGGTIIAQTLSGFGTGGDVILAGNANSIGVLNGYTLAGNNLLLNDTGALNVTGIVAATNISLAAAAITLNGNLISPNGTVALAAGNGGILQNSGIISAATLTSGTSTTGNSAFLNGTGNTIATLADFALAAGTTLALDDTETLIIAGNVIAPTAIFTAPAIVFAGNLVAANELALENIGMVTQTGGSISTNLLTSGNTTDGTTALTGPNNAILTLGNYTVAAGGTLALTDASALTVAGPVTAPIIDLTAASIDFAGAVSSGELALSSPGNISQTAGAIDTAILTTNAATIGGNTNLTASTNAITTLASFTDLGNLALTSNQLLSVTGPVTASNIALATAGLNIAAPITTGILQLASTAGIAETGAGQITAATLTTGSATVTGDAALGAGNDIATLGNFAATGALTVNDAQALNIAGAVILGGTLALGDTGNISETGGAITAAALTSDGVIGGDAAFTQNNNIPILGNFAALGNVTLNDNAPITLQGAINNGAMALNLASTGGINQTSGAVTTGILNANATNIALGDANAIATLGMVVTPGNLLINGVDGITGTVDPANATLISAGDFALNGNISIDGQLIIQAAGDVTQTSGGFAANNVTISAHNITLSGTDTIPGELDLAATGNIIHTAGALTGGTLTGTGGSLATFAASTDFGTLASFVMRDSLFSMIDDGPLTIIGPVVANVIRITATGLMTLDGSAGGGLYISGGAAPASETIPRAQDSELAVRSLNGVSNIVETGSFFINSGPDSPMYNNTQVLYTDSTAATIFLLTAATPNAAGGNIIFASAPSGLVAPDVDVILSAGNNGKISGNLGVGSLEVLSAQSTDLTGTIAGITGQAAAGKGSVDPNPIAKFQFNSCPIGSVNCVILPIASVPTSNPLGNFDITQRKRRRLNKNVQLPGIATHDY